MYRPADVDNPRDFSQYYRGGYIGYNDPQNPEIITPLLISRTDDEGNQIRCHRMQKTNTDVSGTYRLVETVLTFPAIMAACQFGMPQYGSTVYGNGAQYLSRNAPREGYRGYRTDRLRSHVFAYWFYRNLGLAFGGDADNDAVWYTFNPYYYPAQQAFTEIHSGTRLGCPISRFLTVHADTTAETPAISYKTEVIGAFSKDGSEIVISSDYVDYLPALREITKMRVVNE